MEFGGIWVFFDPELLWSNTDQKRFEAKQKIIVRQTGDTLTGAIDAEQYYTMDTTHLIYPKTISAFYLLTLINSTLLNWCHRQIVPEEGKAFAEVKIVNLERLPIRRIPYTTPPDRRAALVEQAKALYSEFLGAPDSQKLLEFVGMRLAPQPEESDVVHDLLAHLAEWMIERNKEKNAEIKSFLDFLKGEIGVSVEDLSNKTAIQEYYSHEFQNLIDVLVKNKKKLKAGYDPKSPSNYKHLQQWYNDSTGKLKPLMSRIEATVGLIPDSL